MNARRLRKITAPLLGLGVLLSLGCQSQGQIELERRVSSLEDELAAKDHQLASQQSTIAKLHKQVESARGLTDADLEKIFYPDKIVIDRLSGGDDFDGRPGDDGVTVYLKPVDRDGDAVKVAGDIRIELYDLQNPSGQKLIGEYEITSDKVSKLWYGKLATYHYTIRCPWQQGPPKHDEITIRATFVDFLTQRVMTDQTVRKVKPSP